jgi:hypothetical protein
MNQPFIIRSDQNGSSDDRWISRPARINGYMSTIQSAPGRSYTWSFTPPAWRASAFYSELLHWEPELIRAASSS